MELKHPPSLVSTTVHVSATTRRSVMIGCLVCVYALVLQQVYTTIGQPYDNALKELEAITKRNLTVFSRSKIGTGPVEAEHTLDDLFEFVEDAEEEESQDFDNLFSEDEVLSSQVGLNAKKDIESVKELARENDRPLPSQMLPSAFSAAALFFTITFHALFHLLCHWMASFRAWALFYRAQEVKPGHYVLCITQKHRGKSDMVRLCRSHEDGRVIFEFQRLMYQYASASDLKSSPELGDEDLVGSDNAVGAIRVVRCPVDLPLKFYTAKSSQGLTTSQAEKFERKYGKNKLSVSTPRFLDLWKKQMLSPIAMFQFFSAALWLLDSYWQYTLFTLFSIMALESTTAFQRLRTLGALNKMSTKPKPVLVYRNGMWKELSAESLQPGDLISISVRKQQQKDNVKSNNKNAGGIKIVPCDCLILRGSAIANEATLTGESVPQMKDALVASEEDNERRLEIQGRDRMHVLFSGTSIMNTTTMSKADDEESKSSSSLSYPNTPDGGCLCYVLRTGFSSSQGEMMQLIEFSMDTVSADNKETFLALFVLLCFALVAAAYVLRKGMEKGDRTTHELLLKCVIILTSVVPQHLPLQIAIAVNTALMALMKAGIFCTEPFRVPIAGKVKHCLFDKTGTLTTDQLIAVGVINASKSKKNVNSSSKNTNKWKRELGLLATNEADLNAQLVLSSCHSLVSVDGKLVGDPIELSALMGVEWNFDAKTNTSRPGTWIKEEAALRKAEVELEAMKKNSTQYAEAQRQVTSLQSNLNRVKENAMRQKRCVRILQRHHFASKLQRMSTVCEVRNHPSRSSVSETCCLVKGSPEVVQTILNEKDIPKWYESTYRKLAEEGMRVLALAYKWCPPDAVSWSRQRVESDLQFAGFVAFSCIVRADSSTVIRALKESGHQVAMVTGDQPLTALHVAKEVCICKNDRTGLLLTTSPSSSVRWVPTSSESRGSAIPFQAAEMQTLSQQYNLVVTEKALNVALENTSSNEILWKNIDSIRVFARMSPQGKARVVDALQTVCKTNVLMCGDGGNDVGALKQSDIGLALLSGYGNANTANVNDETKSEDTKTTAEDELNAQQDVMAKRSKEAAKIKKAAFAKRQNEIKMKQQQWIQEEIEKLRAEGKDGMGAYWTAFRNAMSRVQNEMNKEKRSIAKAHGNSTFGVDSEAAAADPFAAMDGVTVRPGDASAAAPFTSRAPSVRSVVTLLRQGRCTLLSALQQQQIMMLECIISAYTLSVLSLEDARASERQLMASGWLISIASIAFSYSSPVKKMSKERPLNSLFHPAIFISILGQALIHLFCMVTAVKMATEAMGEEELAEVREFNRLARLGEQEEPEFDDDADWSAEFMFMWSKPFRPNLLNTVVFLVETAQMNAVLFVNYKGRPWMKGMIENHALFMSVFICVAAVAACAWGIFPTANSMLHLEPFPTDEFRWKTMGLVGTSLIGTFIWDRIVTAIFAWDIFKAMMREAAKTTPLDLLPVFMSALKVFGGLLVLGSGNPLIWIGAFYAYRKFNRSS